MIAQIPVRRIATVEDVAWWYVFLASDRASYSHRQRLQCGRRPRRPADGATAGDRRGETLIHGFQVRYFGFAASFPSSFAFSQASPSRLSASRSAASSCVWPRMPMGPA